MTIYFPICGQLDDTHFMVGCVLKHLHIMRHCEQCILAGLFQHGERICN